MPSQQTWRAYMRRMAQPTTWGDNLTLQAASSMLEVRIKVLKAGTILNMEPCPRPLSPDTFWVQLRGEVHYQALRERPVSVLAGGPSPGPPKKRERRG